jgi:hypothetical protein
VPLGCAPGNNVKHILCIVTGQEVATLTEADDTSNKAFRLQTPFAAVPPHIRAMWPQMSEGFHIHTQTMR